MNWFVKGAVNTLKPLFRLLYPAKVFGNRNVENKKTLLISNHLSGFDMIMYVVCLKQVVPFVYKAELGKSNFLRWVFNGLDGIPVRRGEVDLNASRKVLQTLNSDKPLFLFPEGTRNPNVDCLQDFHTGVAFYALKTHAPIVPYYIWEKSRIFRKNYIVVGKEFTLEQFYDQPITKDVLLQATEIVRNSVEELRLWLDGQLQEKGVKRRKRTAKETKKIIAYNQRQRTLAKTLASQNEHTACTNCKTDGESNK